MKTVLMPCCRLSRQRAKRLWVPQNPVLIPRFSLQESLLEEGSSGDKRFYGSDEDEDEDEDEEEKEKKADTLAMAKRKPYVMDPDHRLLLRNTKPLLQSRNAAVSGPRNNCSEI